MLLSIFIFIIAFSLLLIIIGKYTDAPVGSIAGAGVLFIAGVILMFSTIEYQSGSTSTESYSYISNLTDSVSINQTNVYSTWDEEEILGIKTRHMIAFTILVTAILLFISILSNLREGGGLDDE